MKDQHLAFFMFEKPMILCLLPQSLNGHQQAINVLSVICSCCLRSYTYLRHAEITTIPWPQHFSTVLLFTVCTFFSLPHFDSFQLVSFTSGKNVCYTCKKNSSYSFCGYELHMLGSLLRVLCE